MTINVIDNNLSEDEIDAAEAKMAQMFGAASNPRVEYEPQQVALDREKLILLNYYSEDAMINTCIPDELELPIPDLHRMMLRKMCHGGKRQAHALPRGTAKTTLAKICVAKIVTYFEHDYVIYLSATHPNASNYVKDIIATLRSPNYEAIYGPIEMVVEQTAFGMYQFWMNRYTVDEATNKVTQRRVKVTIQSRGAGQAVRGLNINNKRPSFLVVDDVEKKEDNLVENNYKKLKQWFYGTMLKALDKRRMRIMQIGNFVSQICLLRDHLESDSWESMRFGIIKKDGTSLWPELWPLEEILDDYRMYQEQNELATWYAEMMNLPMPTSGGLITMDQISYCNTFDALESNHDYAFITVDLAHSKKEWADATAVAVHVWTGQYWAIAQTIHQRGLNAVELHGLLRKLAVMWRVNYIGIESVGYQAAILPVYKYLDKLHNVTNLVYVPCPARNSKTERLSAWAGLIMKKFYRVPMNQQKITSQLLGYDPTSATNDDDLIDACAHGPFMLQKYLSQISRGYMSENFASPHQNMGKELHMPMQTV